MFKSRKAGLRKLGAALACATTLASAPVGAESLYAGIGRGATPKEIAAWDIDVRPDFKGLPVGSGTVAQGMDIWEAKCASCHGVFGESNQTFSPLVGGTTADDIKTVHVARLNDAAYPGRTTLMKVSSLSTLWDFINRAMPWNEPKSLSANDVYAVVAYLLNLGNIVPENLVLSNTNMAEVQKLLPNRNGVTTDHGLWPGKAMGNGGKPDVKAVACMKDCVADTTVKSSLPDFARNAHGNLAEQNRLVGAQHGADTTKPELKTGDKPALPAAPKPQVEAPASGADAGKPDAKKAVALLQKNGCLICHGMSNKIVGPAYSDVAKKYMGQVDYLAAKIKSGGAGVWGPIPMPAQALSVADAKTIAVWLAAGAGK